MFLVRQMSANLTSKNFQRYTRRPHGAFSVASNNPCFFIPSKGQPLTLFNQLVPHYLSPAISHNRAATSINTVGLANNALTAIEEPTNTHPSPQAIMISAPPPCRPPQRSAAAQLFPIPIPAGRRPCPGYPAPNHPPRSSQSTRKMSSFFHPGSRVTHYIFTDPHYNAIGSNPPPAGKTGLALHGDWGFAAAQLLLHPKRSA